MTSVIEKLWDNNLDLDKSRPEKSIEMKDIIQRLEELREDLFSTLTEDQIKTFKDYESDYAKITALSEKEIFVYAFKLGARMGLEIVDK